MYPIAAETLVVLLSLWNIMHCLKLGFVWEKINESQLVNKLHTNITSFNVFLDGY